MVGTGPHPLHEPGRFHPPVGMVGTPITHRHGREPVHPGVADGRSGRRVGGGHPRMAVGRALQEALDIGGEQHALRLFGFARSDIAANRAASIPSLNDAIARTCPLGAPVASHITRSTSTRSSARRTSAS